MVTGGENSRRLGQVTVLLGQIERRIRTSPIRQVLVLAALEVPAETFRKGQAVEVHVYPLTDTWDEAADAARGYPPWGGRTPVPRGRPWRSVVDGLPPPGRVVEAYRTGDLYPVYAWYVGGGQWVLEEGGPEDGAHRRYPFLSYPPTHWREIEFTSLPRAVVR